MADPTAIAFLGCGNITMLHSRTLASVAPDVTRFYASRSRERAEEYRGRFGGAAAFGSYDEAIADPRVGAVFIATPPGSHRDLAERALDAGRHVIVEKPPFLSSADFDAVADAATRAGRRLLVAENYHYRPLVRSVRRIVESGVLGEVRFVSVHAVKRQTTGDWRDDPAIAGGGALFEGGIHWMNLMGNLGLSIAEVHGFRPGSGEGIERSLLIVMRYREGAVGTLYHSWEIPSVFKGLRLSKIFGTEGSVTFESNGLFVAVRAPGGSHLHFPGFRDIRGYRAMLTDFVGAIRENREADYTMDRARADLALVEAAYRSAE